MKNEIMKLNNEIAFMKIDHINKEKSEKNSAFHRERSRSILPPLEITYVEWKEFEFVTFRRGATGPTKSECISYYAGK